jgi:SAM-dependent methyltransferase
VKRFDFGGNWISYSRHALTKERIEAARNDFKELFRDIALSGSTFLDIGFGQGLALLYAAERGAEVIGCDINTKCKESLLLTAKAFGSDPSFPIVIGSILSEATISQLQRHHPTYDIVHSWGVLHHTGDMAQALHAACNLTRKGGYLVLALYNKHWSSKGWQCVKWLYCHVPSLVQRLLVAVFVPVIFMAKLLVTGRNPLRQQRGMDFYHDCIDWIGGYPYEFASVQEVRSIVERQSFECVKVIGAKVPTGCNQFVFRKNP